MYLNAKVAPPPGDTYEVPYCRVLAVIFWLRRMAMPVG